jgi:hypothetical protein
MSTELRKDEKSYASKIHVDTLNALLGFYKDGFDLEEKRKETLESKASMILGFSGIIAGLITGLGASSADPLSNPLYIAFFIASTISFTIAGIYALLTVKLKNYMQLFNVLQPEQIDNLLTKYDETIVKNEYLKNMSDALLNNQVLNNQKAGKLNIAFACATAGIFLTLIAAIFNIFQIL